MEYKKYVDVILKNDKNGKIKPMYIIWEADEDGIYEDERGVYQVDEIIDITRAASLKAGGAGIRYTIRIGNSVTFLFHEENRWFVERKY